MPLLRRFPSEETIFNLINLVERSPELSWLQPLMPVYRRAGVLELESLLEPREKKREMLL